MAAATRAWILTLFAVCGARSDPAAAWGHDGHVLIGAVADTLIAGTPAAAQVKRILGAEPLQQAALWADCARNVTDAAPHRYIANPRFPECEPFETPAGQQELESYVARNLTACHPSGEQEVCHKQYHFTDVAVERDSYERRDVGTSDHDVVGAIEACIAVLQGKRSPAPFDIENSKEALRLLAHFVGDVHQPLHVGAVYLSPSGELVDPDRGRFDPQSATRGGNLLKQGPHNLHSEWDGIPTALRIDRFKPEAVTLAARVAPVAGALKRWPIAWASDTVIASHEAFAGLRFGPEESSEAGREWSFHAPRGYARRRHELQRTQLVKAAARLAQVLEAIWR